MATRNRSLAMLALSLGLAGLACSPATAAEKTIGRQVQSWRPRPLSPLLPDAKPAEPVPSPAAPETPSDSRRPAWEAWITRILNGQPLIVFQPSWKGAWPSPRNPWDFSLTPGLRGDPTAGFGAEVVLSGGWSLWGLRFEGDSHLLWAETSGITSWRAAVIRGGLTLECRGWIDETLRTGDLSATAAYRQPF